jgi:hypothetical protein
VQTVAALENELTYLLSSKNEAEVIEDENGNQHILVYHQYINQAEGWIYKINSYDPLPEFVIWKNDIPFGLKHALKRLGEIAMERVITNALRRLYESVDPTYYHRNGINGKVKWRFGSG